VSNQNNIIKNKEISLIDFILSFWINKKILIFILFLSFIFGFSVENFIQKKSKVDIELKSRDLINIKIYPSESRIYKYSFGRDNKIELDFYYNYFEKFFLSRENLNNFSKLNAEKYNFFNYIKKNKTNAYKPFQKSSDYNFTYRIILPNNVENKNFFKEYLFFSFDVALKNFKVDVLNMEQKKLSTISRDIKHLETILEKVGTNYDVEFKDSRYLMELFLEINILKNEEKNLIYNLDVIRNLNSSYLVEQHIFVGPTSEILNEKYYNLSKFILPIILSLIIYIVFILIKFVKSDHKN
tara:strand:+ start:2026 stop:2916 length:891 start_codon:yes stop_codon:yes gene_type:complete